MMLKIIGSVLVIGASTFLGLIFSKNCAKRPYELRTLGIMLQALENELVYLSNVLSDAFKKISKLSDDAVSEIFRDAARRLEESPGTGAADAWKKAIKANIKNTSLDKEDEEVLLSFGKMLGSTDIEGQVKNIRLTLEHLKMQELKAEEKRKSNVPLYRNLGLLLGIAIVLLLF